MSVSLYGTKLWKLKSSYVPIGQLQVRRDIAKTPKSQRRDIESSGEIRLMSTLAKPPWLFIKVQATNLSDSPGDDVYEAGTADLSCNNVENMKTNDLFLGDCVGEQEGNSGSDIAVSGPIPEYTFK